MNDLTSIGKLLIYGGLVTALVGVVLTFGGKFLHLGRLPGDIFVQKGNFTLYFPLVSSIVISLLLTIILNFILRK